MGISQSFFHSTPIITTFLSPLPPLHNSKIVLELNGETFIHLQSDGVCKTIPPIYQFRPLTNDEPQLKWIPFEDPSTLPNSITWQSNEEMPKILTTSQGPKISYRVWVNDNYLLQSGDNVIVMPVSTGGSWSQKRQTVVFKKGYYCVDDIQFEYNDGNLKFSYFSWQESN